MDYITYIVVIALVIFGVIYFKKQFLISRDIRLEDTTLEELDDQAVTSLPLSSRDVEPDSLSMSIDSFNNAVVIEGISQV